MNAGYRYWALLAGVALIFLGPVAAFAAAYMNFRIGTYNTGSMMAGLLGSVVVLRYGKEGLHGANYIQTLVSTMGCMGAMSCLIQAMAWMKMEQPSGWSLTLLFLAVGMTAIGIGQLYTRLLVDRWELTYPSAKAVAAVLRALSDITLLRRSVLKLGLGAVVGVVPVFQIVPKSLGFSAAIVGTGLIVGARIALPAATLAVAGWLASPLLVRIGWLNQGQEFRVIGFLFALAMLFGAALVHLYYAFRGISHTTHGTHPRSPSRVQAREIVWIAFWGTVVLVIATTQLGVPLLYAASALGLTFLFLLVNGIAYGVSDANPISAAFVLTVLVVALLGLTDPLMALLCGGMVLMGCSLGVDMQADRSTGWRLGSSRAVQFRFQAMGVVAGAPLAVLIGQFFLTSFPELRHYDANSEWASAMTFKLVGIVSSLDNFQAHQVQALVSGFVLGITIEVLRRILKRTLSPDGKRVFSLNRRRDFVVDALLLPTPFAMAFGGFLPLTVALWFAFGGVLGTTLDELLKRRRAKANGTANGDTVAHELGDVSLVASGLIAGEALSYVGLGTYLMMRTFL